jgi:hypothetical protein
MFDDVNASLIPSDAAAVAYYVDRPWANLTAVQKQCPHAKLLPIITSPADTSQLKQFVGWENGVAWDIENGDWTPTGAAPHIKAAHTEGIRPIAYGSVSSWPGSGGIIDELHAWGLQRSQVGCWTAHYIGAHICSPSCWGQLSSTAWGSFTADGTQFTDTADGRSLDESELGDGFFAKPAPAPKPPAVKHATGLMHLNVTFNADPPHGHNWQIVKEPGGNFKPGSEDHWSSAEIQVNRKTGDVRIRGMKDNSPPLGS